MDTPTKERWQKLCEDAAVEQDPKRLAALLERIDHILQEKEKRLRRNVPNDEHGA